MSSSSNSSMILCSNIVVLRNQASRIAASIFLSYQVYIASHTRIKITQSIFLNNPFGSLAHLRFLISFCPNIAIAKRMAASQRVYDTSARNQNKNHAGSMIARIRAYVGLHELNTGPNANHINIYLLIHFFD